MAKRNKAMDAEIAGTLMGDIGKFELLMVTHWKLIVAAGIAVVIVIGLVFGLNSCRKAADRKAANALSAAVTEEQLEQALAQYPDNPAARFARLRLARLYMNADRFEDAVQQFRLLENSGVPQEMLHRIRLDEAYLLENAGKVKEAAEQFDRYSRDAVLPAAIRAEAGYSAGRLFAEQKLLDRAAASLQLAVSLLPEIGGGNLEWCRLARFLMLNIESGACGPYTPVASEKTSPANAVPEK